MVRERGASRPPSLFAAWDNPKPMFCCGGEQAIANPTEKRGRQEAIVEVFGGVARRRTQIGTRPRETVDLVRDRPRGGFIKTKPTLHGKRYRHGIPRWCGGLCVIGTTVTIVSSGILCHEDNRAGPIFDTLFLGSLIFRVPQVRIADDQTRLGNR